MAAYYEAGGQRLYDDQVPFAPGSNEFYRYVARWRAKAMGVALEAPEGYGDQWHRVAEDDPNYQRYKYWMDQVDAARAQDRRGLAPQGGTDMTPGGYIQTGAGWVYDANRNGVQDPGEQAGKWGGAGNNPGTVAADNRWNDLWGKDVRTDQQKFYDRDLEGFAQTADENGTYNWYADWTYRDAQGKNQKRKIDLTKIGNRRGSTGNGQYDIANGAGFSGTDYWNYNDAPTKSWFDEQVRRRENLSKYARTA